MPGPCRMRIGSDTVVADRVPYRAAALISGGPTVGHNGRPSPRRAMSIPLRFRKKSPWSTAPATTPIMDSIVAGWFKNHCKEIGPLQLTWYSAVATADTPDAWPNGRKTSALNPSKSYSSSSGKTERTRSCSQIAFTWDIAAARAKAFRSCSPLGMPVTASVL